MSRPYPSNEYGGIAQMMLNTARDEQPYVQGITSLVQKNAKMPKLQIHPQDPEDGQGRHGKKSENVLITLRWN